LNFFLGLVLIVQTKDQKCPRIFFSIPTIFFIVKELCLLLFSTRLHFLNNFKNTSHIEILKIKKCNKDVNLLLYKILVYQILKFVSPYQEFAIGNLEMRHCVFLVFEGVTSKCFSSYLYLHLFYIFTRINIMYCLLNISYIFKLISSK